MEKQAAIMKSRGVVVGTRNKSGRTGFLYMINNVFAEILYQDDNPRLEPESVVVIDGLKNLNRYMEKALRDEEEEKTSRDSAPVLLL